MAKFKIGDRVMADRENPHAPPQRVTVLSGEKWKGEGEWGCYYEVQGTTFGATIHESRLQPITDADVSQKNFFPGELVDVTRGYSYIKNRFLWKTGKILANRTDDPFFYDVEINGENLKVHEAQIRPAVNPHVD